jgi:imidazolonepropionase-like amidohydrolase
VLGGVDSIEHGTFMSADTIALMKQKGTWYVPTLMAGAFVAEKAKQPGYFPEIVRPKAQAIGPQIQATLGRAYKAGLKIAFGTDSGVSAHGDNAGEFALLVQAGMPPIEALRAATRNAAELFGEPATLGTLEPGKFRGRRRGAGRSAAGHRGDDEGRFRAQGRCGLPQWRGAGVLSA